ncbi:hypothetical protein WMF37_06040 [Sorangium sp. So ce291]|uniref:hypothetical protein n=1 Tax=Sorangium sp. So ce291 TaxID=3133294 RepID=UPI003F5D8054
MRTPFRGRWLAGALTGLALGGALWLALHRAPGDAPPGGTAPAPSSAALADATALPPSASTATPLGARSGAPVLPDAASAGAGAPDALVETAERLTRLRDEQGAAGNLGCAVFQDLARFEDQREEARDDAGPSRNDAGPLIGDAAPPIGDDCGSSARLVRCLEGRSGLFVPVREPGYPCAWRLWLVPRATTAKIVEAGRYEEFDLSFTTAFSLDDVERDGEQELLLGRRSEHPEGMGGHTELRFVRTNGEALPTPFDEMRDVDRDGLVDGILLFDPKHDGARCHEGAELDPWIPPVDLGAVSLVAHRLPDGSFTFSDDVAARLRQSTCRPPLEPLSAVDSLGVVQEAELARRLLCSFADDVPVTQLERALATRCSVAFRAPDDCKARRPGVCAFREGLEDSLRRLSQLPPWLARPPRAPGDAGAGPPALDAGTLRP